MNDFFFWVAIFLSLGLIAFLCLFSQKEKFYKNEIESLNEKIKSLNEKIKSLKSKELQIEQKWREKNCDHKQEMRFSIWQYEMFPNDLYRNEIYTCKWCDTQYFNRDYVNRFLHFRKMANESYGQKTENE